MLLLLKNYVCTLKYYNLALTTTIILSKRLLNSISDLSLLLFKWFDPFESSQCISIIQERDRSNVDMVKELLFVTLCKFCDYFQCSRMHQLCLSVNLVILKMLYYMNTSLSEAAP